MKAPTSLLLRNISGFWLLFACAGSVALAQPAYAVDGVGNVISIKPGAYVLRGGQRLPLEQKSRIHQKDTVETDASGKLQIIFDDDTTLALAADTQIAIETVVTDGNPRFKNHMYKGLARFITGKIVEQNPEGFEVTTPEGTVGIRGTILAVESRPGVSKVHVFQSGGTVLLNSRPVGMGQTGVALRGVQGITTQPLTPEIKQEIDQATGKGVASAPVVPGGQENQNTGNPENTALALVVDNTLSPPDRPLVDPLSIGRIPSRTALVSGGFSYNSNGSVVNFSFLADLLAGTTSNGVLSSSGSSLDFVYSGGSGTIDATDWNITNFTTSSTPSHDPSGGAGSTYIGGTYSISGNSLTVNSLTPATRIVYGSGGGSSLDDTFFFNGGGTIVER